MLQVFNDLWVKLAAVGAVILGLFLVLLKYGADKKAEGAHSVVDEINKKNQKVQDEWDKIDSSDPTVDQSLERLRKRSGS